EKQQRQQRAGAGQVLRSHAGKEPTGRHWQQGVQSGLLQKHGGVGQQQQLRWQQQQQLRWQQQQQQQQLRWQQQQQQQQQQLRWQQGHNTSGTKATPQRPLPPASPMPLLAPGSVRFQLLLARVDSEGGSVTLLRPDDLLRSGLRG
ncbi:hypothetical protein Agub_g391, partial [Astrephomene gubernaculifera]